MNKVPKRLQRLISGLRIIMHNKHNRRSKIKTIIPAAPETQVVPAIPAVLPTVAEVLPVGGVPVAVAPLSMVV